MSTRSFSKAAFIYFKWAKESKVLLHINYKSVSIPQDRKLKWLNIQIQSYSARGLFNDVRQEVSDTL